jgi:IPTL-CTERM motif
MYLNGECPCATRRRLRADQGTVLLTRGNGAAEPTPTAAIWSTEASVWEIPTAVPTLSESGMLALVLLLIGSGYAGCGVSAPRSRSCKRGRRRSPCCAPDSRIFWWHRRRHTDSPGASPSPASTAEPDVSGVE